MVLLSSEASGKLLDVSSWGGWGRWGPRGLSLDTEAHSMGVPGGGGLQGRSPSLASCPHGLGAPLHCGSPSS